MQSYKMVIILQTIFRSAFAVVKTCFDSNSITFALKRTIENNSTFVQVYMFDMKQEASSNKQALIRYTIYNAQQ